MSRRRVDAPAVVAWLVAVLLFGLLHYSWVRDNADGAGTSLLAAALWGVFFGLAMWWSQRKAAGPRE